MSTDSQEDKKEIPPKTEYDQLGFIKSYKCPHCSSELKFDHEDDVGTKFFKCAHCEKYIANPKSEERKELEKELEMPEPTLEPQTSGEERKRSQADRLVSFCLSNNPLLFHDQHKTPFARINQAGVNVIMPLRSRQFKCWLANLMWRIQQKAPGTEGINSAINILQGKALLEGEQHTLYNRVAPGEDGFWIDMCDDKWRAIKVDAEGWRIVENPPTLFRRYSHQLPLVEPIPGGDPWRLLNYINIDKNDEDTKLTIMCNCTSYFVPLIPHLILILYGIQGSGKTWVFMILRRIFDPSSIEVLAMPRDEREGVQQLDHHWLAFYDNITSIPTWISDRLCRAATGGGFTKRELFSDDEDVIYMFKRCVGLNGINVVAQRGDLLDRGLLIGLEHITPENRKTEQQLLADFEKEKAGILGGFLDVLVRAIQLYPTINSDKLFRMADFTRWGCAIAKALGRSEEEFINAYGSKVKIQIEEAAHGSPVATVLLDYSETVIAKTKKKEWSGTPSDLFIRLLEHAKTMEISTRVG
jgi:DNA-directed RNA polymerase subunit RPC12/RpoP